MTIKQKIPPTNIEIDLTGPDGNAYQLLAYASQFAKQFGYSKEDIKALHDRMTSSDYDHLVKMFDDEFGHFITLLVDTNDEAE